MPRPGRRRAVVGNGCDARRILTEADLAAGLQALRAIDPEPIERMLAAAGPPPLRKREPGLAGLAWVIVSQQVSAQSAAAIYGRLQARFAGFNARDVLEAGEGELRACGLSAPKIRAVLALAGAIHGGGLNLAALDDMPAEEARAAITAVKGLGPWSADVYLLFCAGHPDIWPVGDLALQEGARMALQLRARPDARRMERLGERWRPWRSVAARLVWAYYGAQRAAGQT